MKFEREKLVPWLIHQVNSGKVPGLRWIDKRMSTFRVTWKHAGKPDFELERDAVLFRMWAEHTGKYKPGEQPDPSTWKTRFRCALRKMPEIEEIRVPHSLDDREPYRVFRVKSKAFLSVSKSQTSITSVMDTPSSSPINGIRVGSSSFSSFPINNHTYVKQPMESKAEVLEFPSPDSSHASSPTHSSDISNHSSIFSDDEDSIDNITPTLPPLSYPSCDFQNMSNMLENGFSAPSTSPGFYPVTIENSSQDQHTFTDFQGSQGTGYVGGRSVAMTYQEIPCNEMSSNMHSSSQYSDFTTENNNGYSTNFPLGLFLKSLYAVATSMETERLDYELTENIVSAGNSMNNCFQQITGEVDMLPQSSSYSEKLVINDMHMLTNSEHHLSIRIFYDETEATAFDLDKEKSTWTFCYGEQDTDTAVYDQIFGTDNTKRIQLPQLSCSNDTHRVLTNFNRGLNLEISKDGDIWATRKSLTKIYFSCGSKQAIKLVREVKTKVFEFSGEFQQTLRENGKVNSSSRGCDVTFTLGWPNGRFVSIVITHVRAKKMILDKRNDVQCTSEPICQGQIAFNIHSHLGINGIQLR